MSGTLGEILKLGVDLVAQRVPNELLSFALKLVLPELAKLVDLERFDARARVKVMSIVDKALRAVEL